MGMKRPPRRVFLVFNKKHGIHIGTFAVSETKEEAKLWLEYGYQIVEYVLASSINKRRNVKP